MKCYLERERAVLNSLIIFLFLNHLLLVWFSFKILQNISKQSVQWSRKNLPASVFVYLHYWLKNNNSNMQLSAYLLHEGSYILYSCITDFCSRAVFRSQANIILVYIFLRALIRLQYRVICWPTWTKLKSSTQFRFNTEQLYEILASFLVPWN